MRAESPDRVERRLAAILAADVVSYSRLMEADEAGTAHVLREHRAAANPLVATHAGRIVKTTGDGVLIEFPSVFGAVQCAVALQKLMAERNAGMPNERRMDWRVGIHLGDVLIEGDDILGDGVNLAARLEGIAEPGGICISEDAFRQVRGKIETEFIDGGEQTLKNISRPVRIYRAQPPPTPISSAPATSALPMPDKPSLAVLPFQNMSGHPEQEYFVDGIVEDITTAIARLPWLFVIARNSSFAYKGQSPDLRQVGRELGVRYVLEGSVRKAGNRVRITGQLIDTTTGAHIWADRFDASLDDIFELQDQVASSVVGAIEPKLRFAEIERASRKPTSSLDAYDLYLRALAEFHKWSADSLREAIRLLRGALSIDPSYAPAAALFGFCRGWQGANGWESVSDENAAEAMDFARQAVDTAKDDPDVWWMAGQVLAYFSGDHATGQDLIERALALNANSALAWCARGWVHNFAAQPEPAIESFNRAMRLSPLDPLGYIFKTGLANAYTLAGRFEEAMKWVDQALREQPRQPTAVRFKATLCGYLGRVEEGARYIQIIRTIFPDASVKSIGRLYRGNPTNVAIHLEGLRKAGLPEE